MDAFFAAVEVRDHPALRGKPVLVGGVGRRAVVAAASYEARRFGCRSAMPMAVALRRCPQAIVCPGRYEVYTEVSAQVFQIFARFSPLVEGLSIDEAFIDVSGTERLHGRARVAAERLRKAVRDETGLTCSVGISAVKFIAKIASAMNKPDGLTNVPVGDELAFLHPLPVAKLWGVGQKTRERLHERGVRTVGDLAAIPESVLAQWFGESGRQLYRLSHAIDPRLVEPTRARKSISHEDTFHVDLEDRMSILERMLQQSTRVADRMIAKGLAGQRVFIKVRDTAFRTETRQRVLPSPTDQAKEIYRVAAKLLESIHVEGRRFRLIGVGVGNLVDATMDEPTQLDLPVEQPEAASGDEKAESLQHVMTEVRRRFGPRALAPADATETERRQTSGAFSKTMDD